MISGKDFHLKIKLARVANGLSQADIAKHLQISQGQYSKIETGENNMLLEHLFKVMDLLDMKWADLDIPIKPLRNPIIESISTTTTTIQRKDS
jgi:transcriptional regulator with XRE-family HTH domain